MVSQLLGITGFFTSYHVTLAGRNRGDTNISTKWGVNSGVPGTRSRGPAWIKNRSPGRRERKAPPPLPLSAPLLPSPCPSPAPLSSPLLPPNPYLPPYNPPRPLPIPLPTSPHQSPLRHPKEREVSLFGGGGVFRASSGSISSGFLPGFLQVGDSSGLSADRRLRAEVPRGGEAERSQPFGQQKTRSPEIFTGRRVDSSGPQRPPPTTTVKRQLNRNPCAARDCGLSVPHLCQSNALPAPGFRWSAPAGPARGWREISTPPTAEVPGVAENRAGPAGTGVWLPSHIHSFAS